MFELVGSSSPDEAPHRQHRQQGISHGSPRPGNQTCDQDTENYTVDLADRSPDGAITLSNGTIATACPTGLNSPYSVLGCNLLDPFNTLCESPERLRQLLRHRMNPNYLFFGTI